MKFPVNALEFPVLCLREYSVKCCFCAIIQHSLRPFPIDSAKVPCIFPIIRESETETGSHKTASTTNKSPLFRAVGRATHLVSSIP